MHPQLPLHLEGVPIVHGIIVLWGLLVRVIAWRRCRAGFGCGDQCLTFIILVVHIVGGLEVTVVDSCVSECI